MANRTRSLLDRLLARRRLADHDGVSDADLLGRFVHNRDEAAFELLVWRHGEMVLGLCRRAVRDEQLAEDAFQAVFLVLARKAGVVRGNLGGWLFRVARRVSARARNRRPTALPLFETAAGREPDPSERAELSSVLDAEVARLPERFRGPVVLCYLGGRSTEDAARELGCPRGTVLSRLAAARKRLAERLTRRGVALPAALAAAGLSPRLVSSAAATALPFRAGSVPHGSVTHLANGVLRTMNRTTILTAFGGVLLAATLATSVGWVAAQQGTRPQVAAEALVEPPKPTPADPPANPPKPAQPDSADSKRAAIEKLKKLEDAAVDLKRTLSFTLAEQEEKRIDRSILEARLADLQKRSDEVAAEYRHAKRELDKLELERSVLKKSLDEQRVNFHADAGTVELTAERDQQVVKAWAELSEANKNLAEAESKTKKEELLLPFKTAVATAETKLKDARKRAAADATEALYRVHTSSRRQRIDQLDIDITINKDVCEKIRDELKELEEARDAAVEVFKVKGTATRASLEPQREVLGRLEREWWLLHLQLNGIALPEPAGTDAKLDMVLRELNALRREVQELKEQKK